MSDSPPTATIRTGDAAIVERARRGDHTAFVALVDAWLPATYRTVLGLVGNEADARETTLEIFGRAWRTFPTLPEPESFEAWFHQIVANTCRTAARTKGRRSDDQGSDVGPFGPGESWAAGSGSGDPRTRRFDPSELRPIIARRTAGMHQQTIRSRRSMATATGRLLGRVISRAALAMVMVAVLLGGLLTLAVVDRRPVPPVQVRSGLLAFIRGQAAYVADPDGSNARLVLDPEGIGFRSVAWAPDGIRLALESDSGTVVLDTRTGATALVRGGDPAWSPDGRLAVIERTADPANTTIRIMNSDGHGSGVVRPFPALGDMAWSPDGHWIAATGGTGDTSSIVLIDAGTGTVVSLNPPDGPPGGSREPAWSPDSQRIAFTRSDESQGRCSRCPTNVFVANADGSHSVRVNLVGGRADGPKWSPDGQWLAFRNVTQPTGFHQAPIATGLTIAHPDGTEQRTLVASAVGSYAWSAESDRLLFAIQPDHGLTAPMREATLTGDERSIDVGVDEGLASSGAGPGFALQIVTGHGPLAAAASLAQAPIPSSGLHLVTSPPASSPNPRSGWPALASDDADACQPITVDGLTGQIRQFARLCDPAAEIGSAAWSPIGSAYALIANGQLSVSQVNGQVHLAVADLAGLDGGVSWSPDGHWLGLDGSQHVVLSPAGSLLQAIPGSPIWSADGQTLAVETPDGGLLVGAANGTDLVPIGTFPTPLGWSSDGSRFAFIRDGNVWTASRAGSDVRNITSFALGGASYGVGSVDGRWIAVTGTGGIWIMHSDGTGRRWLGLGAGGYPMSLEWAPDSSRLAVDVSYASGDAPQILIVRTDAGPTVAIDSAIAPGWSADSRFLVAFSAVSAGNANYSTANLQVMLADGSERHDLPVTPSGMSNPAWVQ